MQSSGLTYEDLRLLETIPDEEVVSVCRELNSNELMELMNYDQRYATLCGHLWKFKVRREKIARTRPLGINQAGVEEVSAEFNPIDLSDLRQAILEKEATLAPGEYLNITNAHIGRMRGGQTGLVQARVSRTPPTPRSLAQPIPGHPQLLASGEAYNVFTNLLSPSTTANGRKVVTTTTTTTRTRPSLRTARYPPRPALAPVEVIDETYIPEPSRTVVTKEVTRTTRPRPSLRTARYGPRPTLSPIGLNSNAFYTAKSDADLFNAILKARDELTSDEVLDITNARLGENGLVNAYVISSPQPGNYQSLSGYPDLVVDARNPGRWASRLSRDQSSNIGESRSFYGANALVNGTGNNTEEIDEIELFRQGILNREALLPPNRALDLTNARPGEGRVARGVVGIRMIPIPGPRSSLVSIPGHPRLYVRPHLYQDFADLLGVDLNQPNGRKPQHAFRPDAAMAGNTTGLKANGRYQDINDFSDEEEFIDEDAVIRDAIFDTMDALPEGKSLDISNVRISQGQRVAGLKVINTPAPGRSGLRRIPGYPKLLVRSDKYKYILSLLLEEPNNSNGLETRSNGCGCGK